MGYKVLIVDDSRIIRHQVKMALSEAGFDVLEAMDGVDGLDKLRQHPDTALVISDVNMPRLNGLAMIERIKENEQHAALPILVLTTEGEDELLDRAKRAGAKGWIIKPFKSELLIAAAKRLTDARPCR